MSFSFFTEREAKCVMKHFEQLDPSLMIGWLQKGYELLPFSTDRLPLALIIVRLKVCRYPFDGGSAFARHPDQLGTAAWVRKRKI